jgi:glycosyltransferase involved in cell wall biosynthesis
MIDFYPGWSNLCVSSIMNGNRMEQSALSRCRLAIYSSDWAANTALLHYKVDASKVKVVPFGANTDNERRLTDIRVIVANRSRDICKLLFLGVDWYRKGGDIAVDVARILNNRGIRTELTIVGCTPPGDIPAFLCVKGFISKRRQEEKLTLDTLFAQSHFLILPSRADCSPVAIAEANSFGIPVLTSNVGGIPFLVRNGVNGFAFPLEVFEECVPEIVASALNNFRIYQHMAESSFAQYESRLQIS